MRANRPIEFDDAAGENAPDRFNPDQSNPGVGRDFQPFGGFPCAMCGKTLSVHERASGETCGSAKCKNDHLRAEVQVEYRRQQALRERALAVEKMLAQTHAMDLTGKRVLGILPSMDRRLKKLPKRRLGVFVDRLMRIISQAAAVRYGTSEHEVAVSGYDTPLQATEQQLAVLGNGCAVCRGHCCIQGGVHAFLHVETILAYMDRNPNQRPRHVLQAYLSRIRNRSYEDSCVYHSENGCELPREMRSKICNVYLCEGQSKVLFNLKESSISKAFVVAVSEQEPVRAAIIDHRGRDVYDCVEKGDDLRSR